MKNDDFLTVTINVNVPIKQIKKMISYAIKECNWGTILPRGPNIIDKKLPLEEVPFVEGGWLQVHIEEKPAALEVEYEWANIHRLAAALEVGYEWTNIYRLDLFNIERGLQIFAKNYSEDFMDLIKHGENHYLSNIFFQCCIFGKVIYNKK